MPDPFPLERAICFMRQRRLAILISACMAATGCVFGPSGAPPPVPILYQNPSLIAGTNHELVWDQIADVVSGYFRIRNEQSVQIVDNTYIEGRIDTYPQGGATLLEPHRSDSVGRYNRWESTLQTIRRRGHVRVTPLPTQGGFEIQVVVEKELEDLPQPAAAAAGAATFRSNSAPRDRRKDRPQGGATPGWIPLGRDVALEQRILAEIHARLGGVSPGMAY